MIYYLRSGVRGVRRAALHACTVMAEQAPILTAYEFATKEGEARHRTEPAALSQAACRGHQAAYEFATEEGEAQHRTEPAALSQATCRGSQAAHRAA